MDNRRQDGALCMDRPAWRLLVDVATSLWHAPESRERERERERQYYAERALCYRPSVCPPVRPSQSVKKRL